VTLFEAAAILFAGMAAGCINTVVGSGTLVTFPTLLAFGVPPVTANISNAIGLVPGSVSGAVGYRRELAGQRARVLRLASATTIGAAAGAGLLLVLPAQAFSAIVPVLILLGLVLVVLQPRIAKAVAARHAKLGGNLPAHGAGWVWPAIGGVGVYCGYFGAAQGVLCMAVLGIGVDDTLQRLNAVKNVLAALGNGVAGVVFLAVALDRVDWTIVGLIAAGAIVGGQVGATWGRKLPAPALRVLIVLVGTIALVRFLVG
jgi:uncharacterized membrane protein YfcA